MTDEFESQSNTADGESAPPDPDTSDTSDTSATQPAEPGAEAAAPLAPPPPGPADAPPPEGEHWPNSAKAITAVLGVLLVAAIIAAIVGFSQDDSDKIDEANARADAAEAELASTTEELEGQIAVVEGERDALADENEQLQSDLDDATALAEELELTNGQLTTENEALVAENEELKAVYPIEATTSLASIPESDLVGNYTIDYTEAYCEGFSSCGTTPSGTVAAITQTPEGFLRLSVPGVLEAGLFRAEGALYGITDSDTVVAPCGDVPRLARVTVTIWADEVTIADDGTQTLSDLQASITVDAPAIDDCPRGLVFYGSNLNRG